MILFLGAGLVAIGHALFGEVSMVAVGLGFDYDIDIVCAGCECERDARAVLFCAFHAVECVWVRSAKRPCGVWMLARERVSRYFFGSRVDGSWADWDTRFSEIAEHAGALCLFSCAFWRHVTRCACCAVGDSLSWRRARL